MLPRHYRFGAHPFPPRRNLFRLLFLRRSPEERRHPCADANERPLLELDVLRRQTTQTAIALALRTERKRVFRVFPCTQACASDSLANVRATSQQTFAPHTWTALSLQVSDSILRRSLRRHAFVVLQ